MGTASRRAGRLYLFFPLILCYNFMIAGFCPAFHEPAGIPRASALPVSTGLWTDVHNPSGFEHLSFLLILSFFPVIHRFNRPTGTTSVFPDTS